MIERAIPRIPGDVSRDIFIAALRRAEGLEDIWPDGRVTDMHLTVTDTPRRRSLLVALQDETMGVRRGVDGQPSLGSSYRTLSVCLFHGIEGTVISLGLPRRFGMAALDALSQRSSGLAYDRVTNSWAGLTSKGLGFQLSSGGWPFLR